MEPSPEVKALLKQWTKLQEEKYGPNWKEIVAKEMTDKMFSSPIMQELTKRLAK